VLPSRDVMLKSESPMSCTFVSFVTMTHMALRLLRMPPRPLPAGVNVICGAHHVGVHTRNHMQVKMKQ
jgi:hypothetical protein